MRFMLIVHPLFPIPPDLLPVLIDGFTAWWAQYQERWEAAGFFAGGAGGGGICRVGDAAEFHRMMLEWPFTPFSRIETHALVDMDTALSQWQGMIAAMGQAPNNT